MTRALITGAGGQDGSYLAESLLVRGYEVVAVVPRDVSMYPHLEHIAGSLSVVRTDLLEGQALMRILAETEPDEVYNLASVSFVPSSWDEPIRTAELAAVGVTTLLEAVRQTGKGTRFYQASSSEIFGAPPMSPQDEATPLAPVTPYGVAKAYGHLITRSYRARYGLHASSGILFNHESPRRSPEFLPRKVARAAARISLGLDSTVMLGDLDARRDWGYAPDYVEAMRLMVRQEEPDDYVIASGESHTVRELVEVAFSHVGLEWQEHVRVDEKLVRGRAELHNLVGDARKARERLGWNATVDFAKLVRILVDADVEAAHG